MHSNRWSYPNIVVVGIGSSENSEGVGIGPNSPRKPTVSAGDVDGQRPIGSGEASSCKVDEGGPGSGQDARDPYTRWPKLAPNGAAGKFQTFAGHDLGHENGEDQQKSIHRSMAVTSVDRMTAEGFQRLT